jgi:3-phosphoshikimate 1-carboxyvinyltransferase
VIQVSFENRAELHSVIQLPVSKSEANRALMLSAWSKGTIRAARLSDANDCRLLQELLEKENAPVYSAEDAGTTFRFLASFLALNGKNCLLTGSNRMKERPIAGLVDALSELGCKIEYAEQEGFPPIRFLGFNYSGKNRILMPSISSSQFISSLMMAAPSLPEGIKIQLPEDTGSFPYIELTASMMAAAGLQLEISRKEIHIPNQPWKEVLLDCGTDWSAASYWYGILACLPVGSSFDLPGLQMDSPQGDKVVAHLCQFWNIESQGIPGGVRISKTKEYSPEKRFRHSFQDCPDLALSFICLCAATGTSGDFSGLSSLRLKESDRLVAIQEEMKKVGLHLLIHTDGNSASLESQRINWPDKLPEFNCHQDHRIAMSLVILLAGKQRSAAFSNARVVNKSYPGFWEEIKKAGFSFVKQAPEEDFS